MTFSSATGDEEERGINISHFREKELAPGVSSGKDKSRPRLSIPKKFHKVSV